MQETRNTLDKFSAGKIRAKYQISNRKPLGFLGFGTWSLSISCIWYLVSSASPALAAIPAIQVSPLKYQDTLAGATSKLGFVDVSNPTDSTISLHSEVEAFRQINLSGDLQFYKDDAITQGITVSATDFQVGPREADRIAFTINPQKMPKGGVYAVIFFSTVPTTSQNNGTIILQSAKAGTLLILDNGGPGKKQGHLSRYDIPLLQIGGGLVGNMQYSNTGPAPGSIAYNPTIGVRASWWGNPSFVNGPLIFPGNTREFGLSKPGNYLGIVPIIFSDKDTGTQSIKLVFAITGIWRQFFMLSALLAVSAIWLRRRISLKKTNK